jgi:hypothetical protein
MVIARDAAVSLATVIGYFGLLAWAVRRALRSPAKQAALYILATLPLRLALIGLSVVWLIRVQSLWGIPLVLVGLLVGQLVIGRRVRLEGNGHGH